MALDNHDTDLFWKTKMHVNLAAIFSVVGFLCQ